MVFSSFTFLFFFLPCCLAIYFLTPSRWKNLSLLCASLIFYAWGAPKIFPLFFLSCVIDYIFARFIGSDGIGSRKKKVLFISAITLNVGSLLYFKYANFFVGDVNDLLAFLGFAKVQWTAVVLPIGISFFTFHKISYLVDVFRGIVTPARSFINFALYIALFPQLIAGPIIRYHDISKQLEHRRHRVEDVFEGLWRFAIGLGKKVLLADPMGNVADNVFRLNDGQLSTGWSWLGIIAYAYQIYFDFSGYSDMAIGLGRVMGFKFLENFDRPYLARTFTDFWRRWHMSLSRWMRDYLYIPLGGNRVGPWRSYLNLWIVFFLSGLWHGASWTFVVWGLYHGLFLIIDKLFWLRISSRIHQSLNTIITFVLVLFGWVLFRSPDFSTAMNYAGHMINFPKFGISTEFIEPVKVIHNQGIFVFVICTLICFYPIIPGLSRVVDAMKHLSSQNSRLVVRGSFGLACLLLSAIVIATTSYSPFIYFRF